MLFKICLLLGLLNTGGGMVLESFHWLLLHPVLVSDNIFQSAVVGFRMWRKHWTLDSTQSWDLISTISVPCALLHFFSL